MYFFDIKIGCKKIGIYGLGIFLIEFLLIDNNFKYLKIDVVMLLYCIIYMLLRLYMCLNILKVKIL